MKPNARGRASILLVGLLAAMSLPSRAAAAAETWQVPRANARIAFAVTTAGGDEDIYVIEADGSGRQPLVTSQALGEKQPAWSATSQELLFSTTGAIWWTPAGGGERTRLTDLPGDEERPRWSPDGSKILFSHRPGDAEDVYVMAAGGGAATNLTTHPARDSQADWAPDGSKIVFTSNRLGNLDLFVMDADGTNPAPLVTGGGLQRHGSWSPDGTHIVYDSTNGREGTDIFVARADGTGITQLTFNPAHDREPVWSPDGSKILFTSDRTGNHDLYVMDADGTDLVQLTNDSMEERRPDWGTVRSMGVLDASVVEGDGTASLRFDIGLSALHDADVTVDWATSEGPATAGQDYGPSSGTAMIPPGASSVEVSVPVHADELDELDETVMVSLTNPSGAALSRATAVGTIVDDDPPPVLSVDDAAVAETPGGASATFAISLSTISGRDVMVSYATADATASAGADYQPASGVATIPAGSQVTWVSIPVLDDPLDELEEAFDLVLSEADGASVADDRGSATIADDDEPPAVSLGDAGVAEGDQGTTTLEVPVELSSTSGRQVTVGYETADGTASAVSDYQTTTGTLVIPAGEPPPPIPIPIAGDDIDEPDETLTVTITDAGGAVMGDAVATGTVVDDDPEPVASVNDAVSGEGGEAAVTVTLTRPRSTDGHIDYTTANGTATAPEDYRATSGTVTIPAGETEATVAVPIEVDALDEEDEAFTVDLVGSSGAAIGDHSAVVTILDDDPPPQLAVADASVIEGDAGSATALFPVTLSAPSGRTVTVDYATVDRSATAGSDYAPAEGTLSFAPGSTTAQVAVSVAGDALFEGDEEFDIKLSGASGAGSADGEAVGVIVDDDPQPALSVGDESVMEPAANRVAITFTVRLSAPSGRTTTFSYGTVDGTARAPRDYAATSGTGTIPAGASSTQVAVTVASDSLVEGDETFGVQIASASGATIGDGMAIGTIVDEDVPPPPQPEPDPAVAVSDVIVGEPAGSAAIDLTLSAATAHDVVIEYATADGTAVAGADYSARVGSITIPAGQTGSQVLVPVLDDSLDEPDETLTLRLTAVTGATVEDAEGLVEILDDDAPPAISIADTSESEASDTAIFTVSLSTGSSESVGASYATGNGTATPGKDYTRVLGTLKIPAGQTTGTITVPLLNDAIDEPDETFTLVLTGPKGASLADGEATGTIVDDDPTP